MNKKLLLIMPKFYGYEDIIRAEAQRRFDKVYVIYENRDWVSLWHRFVYVYMPSKKRQVLDSFFINEIKKLPKDIGTVLVIRGSSLSATVMQYMRKTFPSICQYVMYQWDGIKNNSAALDVKEFFDSIFTFDVEDSKKYGWIYRPLFYDSNKVKIADKDIDISFLCSLHSQRAKIQEKLKELCLKDNYVFHSHMYCNRFAYYKWKYIGRKPEYKDTNDKDVVFKSLSLDETYDLYSKSKVVVDYTHPDQTGFTMRTIEALGSKCKLVTNNRFIVNADFYNPNNIYIYDGTEIVIPEEFISCPYEDINEEMYRYYSLEGWLDTLLGGI